MSPFMILFSHVNKSLGRIRWLRRNDGLVFCKKNTYCNFHEWFCHYSGRFHPIASHKCRITSIKIDINSKKKLHWNILTLISTYTHVASPAVAVVFGRKLVISEQTLILHILFPKHRKKLLDMSQINISKSSETFLRVIFQNHFLLLFDIVVGYWCNRAS